MIDVEWKQDNFAPGYGTEFWVYECGLEHSPLLRFTSRPLGYAESGGQDMTFDLESVKEIAQICELFLAKHGQNT